MHVSEFSHTIDWEAARIIVKSENWLIRNIIESCIIQNTFDKNMNDIFGLFKIDPITVYNVCKEVNLGKVLAD